MSEVSVQPSILMTGTTGRVGSAILPTLREQFRVAEFDAKLDDPDGQSRFRGDIQDIGAVVLAVEAAQPDCIVHLAGNANENASSEEVYGPNIVGLHNVYQAARMHGVTKVIYASSTFTVSGYPGFPLQSPFPDGRQLNPTDLPLPSNPYGASKVYGEQFVREQYKTTGIRTISLRIGALNYANAPEAPYDDIWLSHRDATQVVERAIVANPEHPTPIYFAISGNNSIYNIVPTMTGLGYTPLDAARNIVT